MIRGEKGKISRVRSENLISQGKSRYFRVWELKLSVWFCSCETLDRTYFSRVHRARRSSGEKELPLAIDKRPSRDAHRRHPHSVLFQFLSGKVITEFPLIWQPVVGGKTRKLSDARGSLTSCVNTPAARLLELFVFVKQINTPANSLQTFATCATVTNKKILPVS